MFSVSAGILKTEKSKDYSMLAQRQENFGKNK
jgi:hypothetical protein